jgi:hypothetical protein
MKDIDSAVDMLLKKVSGISGFRTIAITPQGLVVYATTQGAYPKTCGGHRVTVVQLT